MSITAAANVLLSPACPISNMGMNRLPAQGLGVPLFCWIDPNAAAISAQEMGVDYGVLYKTTSVLYNVSANFLSARELGIPLLCPIYADIIYVREAGLNCGTSYGTASNVALTVPDLSRQCLFSESVGKPSSTSDCWYPQFAVPADNVEGVIDCVSIDHRNIGVWVIAGLLQSQVLLSQILEFVFRVLYLLLKYLYIGIYRVLTFFTPHGKWWPQYLYRLNLLVINCCFTLHKTVAERCRRVRASLLQNILRRNDFLVIRASICRVRRFTVIFVVASCFSPMFLSVHMRSAAVVPDMGGLQPNIPMHVGGGRIPLFNLKELVPHVNCSGKIVTPESSLRFVGHKHKNVAETLYSALGDHVYGKVPLDQFVIKLTLKDAKSIAKIHGVHVTSKFRAENIAAEFKGHSCAHCDSYVSVFTLHSVKTDSEISKKWYSGLDASQKQKRQKNNKASIEQKQKKAENMKLKREAGHSKLPDFPPPPPSDQLQETVALNWCEDTSPSKFMEGGCAICGQLVPLVQLSGLYDSGCDLDVLVREGPGVTRCDIDKLFLIKQKISG